MPAIVENFGNVEELGDEIKDEQEKLSEAVGKLSKAGENVREATLKLDKAKAKEGELQGKIDEMDKSMIAVSEELAKAGDAHRMVEKLKKKVTDTMMMMMQFIDTALREPLFDLGFTEDGDEVQEGFVPADEIDAADVVKKAIVNLGQYCEKTAIPSFNDLKEKTELDLSPLCSFDSTDAIYEDIVASVNKRMAEIKKQLLQVVGWLNPWKVHKDLSMEEGEKLEDEIVLSGQQLAYLEQVKGFYAGPSQIYKYVIGWRKDGPHWKLVAKLKQAIDKLQTKLDKLTADMNATKAANEDAGQAREEAMKELENAQKDEKLAAEEKAAVEEAIANLKEQWEQKRKEMEDWQDKVNKARAALEAARKALDDAFEEGTSFFERAHERQARIRNPPSTGR